MLVQAYGNDALRNNCLPHTGSNVLLVVVVALALIAVGTTLFWLTAEDRKSS